MVNKVSLRLWIVLLCLFLTIDAAKADNDPFQGVPLHGFSDAGWAQASGKTTPRGYSRGFYLGNVDLYINPDMGNRIRFLTEITLEPNLETQEVGIDFERLLVGYVFSNQLSAWIGRFHTPIGYWAMAYQHGAQLQTTIDKPNYFEFEDHFGVVPVHAVGLWLRGDAFVLDDNRLGYMAWIGNGDSLNNDPNSGYGFTNLGLNLLHQNNRDMSYGARLIWFFGGDLSGLQAGVSAMHQRIDYNYTVPSSFGVQPNITSSFGVDFSMYSFHAVYEAHGFESINEFSIFSNKDANNSSSQALTSSAGYTQLAYWFNGIAAPYVRYERGNFNQSDAYFAAQYNGLPYGKGLIGFRYNLSDNSAVKIEVSRTEFNASSATNAGESFTKMNTNYSIRF